MNKGFYIIRNDLTAFAGETSHDHLWVGSAHRSCAKKYETQQAAQYVARALRKNWKFIVDVVQFYKP